MSKRHKNWEEENTYYVPSKKKQNRGRRRVKRQREEVEEDDIVNVFKRFKLNDNTSSSESEEQSESEEEPTQEQIRLTLLGDCLDFFRENAPDVAHLMADRSGNIRKLLVKAFLNKVIKDLDIKDDNNRTQHAGNDSVANCRNLKALYLNNSDYFDYDFYKN